MYQAMEGIKAEAVVRLEMPDYCKVEGKAQTVDLVKITSGKGVGIVLIVGTTYF